MGCLCLHIKKGEDHFYTLNAHLKYKLKITKLIYSTARYSLSFCKFKDDDLQRQTRLVFTLGLGLLFYSHS